MGNADSSGMGGEAARGPAQRAGAGGAAGRGVISKGATPLSGSLQLDARPTVVVPPSDRGGDRDAPTSTAASPSRPAQTPLAAGSDSGQFRGSVTGGGGGSRAGAVPAAASPSVAVSPAARVTMARMKAHGGKRHTADGVPLPDLVRDSFAPLAPKTSGTYFAVEHVAEDPALEGHGGVSASGQPQESREVHASGLTIFRPVSVGHGGSNAPRPAGIETSLAEKFQGAAQGVTGLEHYAKWPVDRARAVADKILHANGHGADARRLTRSMFWEAFSDYETVVEDGSFLGLPSSVFNTFAQGEDTVDPVEVLLVLALFCHGAATHQLRLCFGLFDADKNETMDLPEMITFFTTLCRACVKVGVMPQVPSSTEILRVATDAFAEADVDRGGDLSLQEFQMWARTNIMSKTLLSSFSRARKEDMRKRGRNARLATLSLQKMLSKAKRSKMDGAVAEQVRRANDAFVACKAAMAKLEVLPGFGLQSLLALQGKFRKVAKSGGSKALSKEQFVMLLREEYPVLSLDDLHALFAAFDSDGNGDIDFKEFALGLGKLMAGDANEKLTLLFGVLTGDADDDGVNVAELTSLLEQGALDAENRSKMAEDLLSKLDADNDGTVSAEEFGTALKSQPVLFQTFVKRAPAKLDAVKGSFRQGMKAGGVHFDIPTLTALWKRCMGTTSASTHTEMDMATFRKFMMSEMVTPPKLMPLVDAVFEAVDIDNLGVVPTAELFKALAQVTSTDPEQQAQFFFQIYDADGNGSLSKTEITEMINTTSEHSDNTTKEATALLSKMDRDGDGTITMEEFKEASVSNPRLLQAFAQVFGIDDASDQSFKKPELPGTSVMSRALATIRRKKGLSQTVAARKVVQKQNARDVAEMLHRNSLATLGNVLERLRSEGSGSEGANAADATSPTSTFLTETPSAMTTEQRLERLERDSATRLASKVFLVKCAGSMADLRRGMQDDVEKLIDKRHASTPTWDGMKKLATAIEESDPLKARSSKRNLLKSPRRETRPVAAPFGGRPGTAGMSRTHNGVLDTVISPVRGVTSDRHAQLSSTLPPRPNTSHGRLTSAGAVHQNSAGPAGMRGAVGTASAWGSATSTVNLYNRTLRSKRQAAGSSPSPVRAVAPPGPRGHGEHTRRPASGLWTQKAAGLGQQPAGGHRSHSKSRRKRSQEEEGPRLTVYRPTAAKSAVSTSMGAVPWFSTGTMDVDPAWEVAQRQKLFAGARQGNKGGNARSKRLRGQRKLHMRASTLRR